MGIYDGIIENAGQALGRVRAAEDVRRQNRVVFTPDQLRVLRSDVAAVEACADLAAAHEGEAGSDGFAAEAVASWRYGAQQSRRTLAAILLPEFD